MTQPIKFYFDFITQSSRSIYMFLEASRIPYESIQVSILKGENSSEEYKKDVNRLQLIPAIIDYNFKLTGTNAIFRHLCREKLVPDHWYPRKNLLRCRIDEFLDWKQNNLQQSCDDYFKMKFQHSAFQHQNNKFNLNEKMLTDVIIKHLSHSLSEFENHWIRSDKFMFGTKITIADLIALNDIDQAKMVGYNSIENNRKLCNWYNLVREAMEPYYQHATNQLIDAIRSDNVNEKIASL